MNTFTKAGLLAALSVALVGCAHPGAKKYYPADYRTAEQMIHPVVIPKNIRVKPALGYYLVPPVHINRADIPPSIIPPGSKISEYRAEQIRKHGFIKDHFTNHDYGKHADLRAHLVKSTHGRPSLVLAVSKKKAWARVGRVLRKQGVPMLQKDPKLASYYILDTQVTGNKIMSKTPIYRLRITQDGKQSRVTLLTQSGASASPAATQKFLGMLSKHIHSKARLQS